MLLITDKRVWLIFGPIAVQVDCRSGVVARFDSGVIWAAFPAPPSRHHGVGLWPAKLEHPVEDAAPDHCLSRLRDAVPRLQAAPEH